MTRSTNQPPHNPDDSVPDTPLDPWMLALARDAANELDETVEVPSDMMWARIQRARREEDKAVTVEPAAVTVVRRQGLSRYTRQIAAAAAVLVTGVGIGRYVVPSSVPAGSTGANTTRSRSGSGPAARAWCFSPPAAGPTSSRSRWP
jgi:hypothetical protein